MNPLALFVPPYTMIPSAQVLTGAWANLGPELDTRAIRSIGLWMVLDINDSLDVRVLLAAKHTADHADTFTIPIRAVSTTVVTIQPEYTEFASDLDQKMLLASDLDGIVARVQFKVMAATPGVGPGQFDDIRVTMSF